MNYLEKAFVCILDKADKEVAFDEKWRNDTGYYDHAVDVAVPDGEIWKSQDEAPNSRRIILIGTLMGTFVVFERYTPGCGGNFVVVSNTPPGGHHVLASGSMDYNDVRYLDMIPTRIRSIYRRVREKVVAEAEAA